VTGGDEWGRQGGMQSFTAGVRCGRQPIERKGLGRDHEGGDNYQAKGSLSKIAAGTLIWGEVVWTKKRSREGGGVWVWCSKANHGGKRHWFKGRNQVGENSGKGE